MITSTARRRILLLSVITGAYIALLFLAGSDADPSITFFISIPTALAAFLFGIPVGLAAWLGATVINTLLLHLIFGYSTLDSLAPPERVFGEIVLLFFVSVFGYIHDLGIKLRRELDRRQVAESVEKQRSAELEAIYNASLQLMSTLEFEPIIEQILAQVSSLMKPERIYVFLYDGEYLTPVKSFPENAVNHHNLALRSNGLTYTVARGGKRIVVSNVAQHPLYQNTKWGGAVIGLPLIMGDRVYGVMNLSYDQPRDFTESDLRIIDVLANQAALALGNAGEYQSARTYAEIMERRVIERTTELLNAKERAEAIVNNGFDAIVLLSGEGILKESNAAYKRLLDSNGSHEQELASLFTNPEVIREAVAQVMATKNTVELEANAPGEQGDMIFELSFKPFDDSAEGVAIICTMRDVTDRHAAQMHQQALTQGLRTVLSLAFDLISTPDLDSMWKQAVELAREKLGLERCGIFIEAEGEGYMHGTFGTDHYGNTVDERDQQWLKSSWWKTRQHMFERNAPLWESRIEDQREWVNGQVKTVGYGWIVVTPIHSAYRFVGVFVNDTAITKTPLDESKQEIVAVYASLLGNLYEHKRVEEEMKRALERERELNELKSRFTSMMSHELRTPLASIQLSSDLLKRYYDRQSDESRMRHLEKIEGQVRHMTSMVEDALTFANAEQVGIQLQPKQIDLYALCLEVIAEVKMTQQTHRLEFEASQEVEDWTGEVDPKLLRQVMTNLLFNAIKYSNSGTTICFMLERTGQDAVLRISDQGIGIPKDDQPRIFDVFYRATNSGTVPGTGIGLALVRQIAEAHKGFVTCKSQVGVGTTFTFRIPFFTPSPPIS